MSDGREERAEQEARREWEKTRRSHPAEPETDTQREYESDGAPEREAS